MRNWAHEKMERKTFIQGKLDMMAQLLVRRLQGWSEGRV
jgi:hypothetical protein